MLAALCAVVLSADTQPPLARRATRPGGPLAPVAQRLLHRVDACEIGALPTLETGWWERVRERPWSDTYPQIYHHTMVVPMRWAVVARDAARACLLQEKPARLAKARLALATLSGFSFAPEHYDVGMNYSVWGTAALEAADVLWVRLGTDERASLRLMAERMLAAVKKNDAYWVAHEPGGALNNHYAWHKLCMVACGLFLERPGEIDAALDGPKGILHLLRHGFRDDGLWREASIPYQFAATHPMLLAQRLLRNAGHPRAEAIRTDDGRTIERACAALVPLLFPDRRLPAIGDCYARRPHLGASADYEAVYASARDPHLPWLLRDAGDRSDEALWCGVPRLPRGEAPPMSSRLWPEQGYIALRTVEGVDYWSGRGHAAFLTYSGASVHVNADRLSIQLWADGHLWLPDREARSGAEHAFSANVQASLNRSTICHNALVVDGSDQRHPGHRLDLVEFHALPTAKRATIADLEGRLYDGVRQMRTLIAKTGYTLDLLQVRCDRDRALTWVHHVDGERVGESCGPWAKARLPEGTSWRWLRNPERALPTDTWWRIYRQDGRTFRLDGRASAPVEPARCGFPIDDSKSPELLPMEMVTLRASDAWFVAVYRSGDGAHDATDIALEHSPEGTLTVRLRMGGEVREHVVPALSALIQ